MDEHGQHLRIVPPTELPAVWHAEARVAIEQRDIGRAHPLTPLPAARRAVVRGRLRIDGPEAA